MAIPEKIEYCPIVDSVVELRFSTTIFPNAVFGIIFNSLKDQFPQVDKLPILQLPEQLRDSDPNFKHKAHYKITSKNGYSVQIGPEVVVIGSPKPYPGWQKFSEVIYLVIESIIDLGVIDSVFRLGIRYINFFENNIFDKVRFEISILDIVLDPKNTVIRTEIEKDGFLNTLQIANNATQVIDNQKKIGSIIDIDTFKEYGNKEFLDNYKDSIEAGHLIEKDVFFNLLKPDFLNSLKPSFS